MNAVWEAAKRAILTRTQAKVQTEYAIATKQLTAYQMTLTQQLVERIYSFCQRNGIRLVILDIPEAQDYENGIFAGSVPSGLVNAFRSNSDAFLSSEAIFGEYRFVAELHVPHGHRHISEFTHLLLGLAAAERIQEFNSLQPPKETNSEARATP